MFNREDSTDRPLPGETARRLELGVDNTPPVVVGIAIAEIIITRRQKQNACGCEMKDSAGRHMPGWGNSKS